MHLIKKPVLCNYYVTYRCNAKCSFCDIWQKPSPYVTYSNVKNNLEDLRRLGVKVIDFTGGEPLLHRQIDRFLSLAKSLGFITTITTNGLLFPKKARALAGKVDMLHFSLDSPDREEHDASRGVKCFDHVMRSIRIAKELGSRPDILFTVMSSNIHKIRRVYEEITRPNNLVLILNPIFDYNEVGDRLSYNELNRLSRWGKVKNVYLNEAFIQLRKDGGNHINNPTCKAASSSIVISPENKLILPCYHLGIEEIPVENNLYYLRKHSPGVKKAIRQEGRMPECEGCVINCYFQPSFAVNMNKYWWKALPSTLKYAREKGTWKEMI